LLKKKQLGSQDFWTARDANGVFLVPQYFHDRKQELENQISSFAQFLDVEGNMNYGINGSGRSDAGEQLCVEWNKLKRVYKLWCAESGIRNPIQTEQPDKVDIYFKKHNMIKHANDPQGNDGTYYWNAALGPNLLKLLDKS